MHNSSTCETDFESLDLMLFTSINKYVLQYAENKVTSRYVHVMKPFAVEIYPTRGSFQASIEGYCYKTHAMLTFRSLVWTPHPQSLHLIIDPIQNSKCVTFLIHEHSLLLYLLGHTETQYNLYMRGSR